MTDHDTPPAPSADGIVTAAMLVIGDEILSGRTKDRNVGFLADRLTEIGIDLKEVRIVPDEADMIVEAVRALSARWNLVFTSGGIGPTHDDITADAVAAGRAPVCPHISQGTNSAGDDLIENATREDVDLHIEC